MARVVKLSFFASVTTSKRSLPFHRIDHHFPSKGVGGRARGSSREMQEWRCRGETLELFKCKVLFANVWTIHPRRRRRKTTCASHSSCPVPSIHSLDTLQLLHVARYMLPYRPTRDNRPAWVHISLFSLGRSPWREKKKETSWPQVAQEINIFLSLQFEFLYFLVSPPPPLSPQGQTFKPQRWWICDIPIRGTYSNFQ